MVRKVLQTALDELKTRDTVMAQMIKTFGPATLGGPARAADRFDYLVRSIVHQQLAGTAARAIHTRLLNYFDGRVTPEAVLSASSEILRSCGLSMAKAASLSDLSERVALGKLNLARIARLSDEEVVSELVQVRGIGPWTAEMFLLFCLGRLDIWPTGDFGVRTGFAAAWSLDELPTPKRLQLLGEPFRPYRSVVAWYCWRAADARRSRP